MQNLDIARTLTELADLLEIRGANPFRVRAYRNAVRTIDGLTRPLRDMVAADEDLKELPGIGEDISGYIRELVETGELSIMDEVTREVPRELATLTRLDGIGPKKAKKIWEELDITSVDALEEAVQDGRVEALEGFGEKSARKILRSIEDHRKHIERFLLSEADELVAPLLEHMEAAPGVERIEVAGSYRRRKETVGDIDLLVLSGGDGGEVMDHFTAYPGADRVEMSGETRGAIVLRSGLSVDLRVLPEASYGAALHYFTGSKEHNVEVRKLGVKEGLRINEYGVFRVPEGADPDELEKDEGERVGGAGEEEVFEAVGLAWVEPELRENRGEIEAAADDDLPELITLDDVRGDLQMHSTWSDGKTSIREMAEACRERGYDYLAITDHSEAVTVAGGLDADEVREQWEEIDEIRESLEGIHLFRSLEVDVLKDGSLDLPDDVLAGLDVVLVSVHSYMGLDRDEMTERVVRALAHPEVDILAHPTGRLLNQREPYELDVEAVLEAAAEHGVAVELNANPKRLDLNDRYVRRAKELGVKVVVSTDAHSPTGLDNMRYGVDQARRGWLERGDVLNALSLKELKSWLAADRGAG